MPGLAAPTPLGAFVEYGLVKTLAKWRARALSALRPASTGP